MHDPARSSHGSFYVTTTGRSRPHRRWTRCGGSTARIAGTRRISETIATNGIPAPAYAVVVDPANRDVVYVGTSVGVWRGTLNSGPKWDWQVLSNGLPEASVQDLTITIAGGVRLLRAAVTSRGIWELELPSDGTPRTFVRVHEYDTRRAGAPAVLTDPKHAAPNSALSWHASPDIRVRPRRDRGRPLRAVCRGPAPRPIRTVCGCFRPRSARRRASDTAPPTASGP